jgi:hypothetical protein
MIRRKKYAKESMMDDNVSFQRFVVLTASASFVILVVGGIALWPLSKDFGPEVFTDPALTIAVGAEGANLVRWSMIVDLPGYYLLLLPIALFLWRWFGSSHLKQIPTA